MRLLAPLLLASACGGNSDNPGPSVDAATPLIDARPTTINLTRFGDPPWILALRDGSGAWQALSPTATSFDVASPTYQLLAACQVGSVVETGVIFQAVSDGDVFQPCIVNPDGGTAPTFVQITGQVAQAGSVTMGMTQMSSLTPWSYSLAVQPGMHDLIAMNAQRVAIQRALTITVAAAEPTIDVQATGTPFAV